MPKHKEKAISLLKSLLKEMNEISKIIAANVLTLKGKEIASLLIVAGNNILHFDLSF